MKLRELIGIIKDKASQSRAVLSKSANLSLHPAILRATTHDPHAPPSENHLNALLSLGNGSRASASAVINALMDRLQRTRDSSVSIKCLIAVHHIIKHGTFILRDQLSVYPSAGGRNYLNLSHFRDASTPASWDLSSWVRWYGQYIEHLLCTSRTLGLFLCSSSPALEKDKKHETVSSLTNSDLLEEMDSLVGLVEAASKRPEWLHKNKMVVEIAGLVGEDYLSAVSEISVRLREVEQRLGQLGLDESVELICALKRLEDCEEKMRTVVMRKKAMMEAFWETVGEMKSRVWSSRMMCCENGGDKDWGRLVRRERRVSESARFQGRVVRSGDSVQFPSARLGATLSSRFHAQSLHTVCS